MQACKAKGSYAGCHIRWRGLESYLLSPIKNLKIYPSLSDHHAHTIFRTAMPPISA